MRRATEIYAQEFDRVFLSLPLALRERIAARITDLGARLETYSHMRLQGRDEFKFRVGDHRIIYQFDTDKNEIYLLAMGHRREVYRKR